MALFFIFGVSGSGKTTLMYELRRRGEEAYDTDDECIMASKQTGQVVNYRSVPYDQRKHDPYDWIYPLASLNKLKALSEAKNIFLLGGVDNFNEIIAAADESFWMRISPDLLSERLAQRTKEYGKSSSERQLILDLYKERGAIMGSKLHNLDATKPVEEVADDLLGHLI